jgi:hypothetical protein
MLIIMLIGFFLFFFFVVVVVVVVVVVIHVEKMQLWGEVVLLDNSLISSIRFLVLVNGSSTNFFSSSQGLR